MSQNVVDLNIQGYPFKCVRLAQADFSDIAAVYVVLCVTDSAGNYRVLDVGESGQVGSRIDDHDRKECWKRNCESGSIWVCVLRLPTSSYSKEERRAIESGLRQSLGPTCGSR